MPPNSEQFAGGRGSKAPRALAAYEQCAPYYDVLTADYDHESWVAQLEQLALAHGLRGRRALDVGCGTGKSALPLIRRGYQVSGCDLSPAMVRRARARLGALAQLFVADMRALPVDERFGFVTCLDDALNYLLSAADLASAIRGFAKALVPGGIVAFDLNTVATYRRTFGADSRFDAAQGKLKWEGRRVSAPDLFAATIEPIDAPAPGWRPSLHVQRHHPPDAVIRACRDAGLELLQILGQSSGANLNEAVDEEHHTKLLYLARKPVHRVRRGCDVIIKP